MNTLTLRGQLRHLDDKKFISYVTPGNTEFLLPVVTAEDFGENEWVHFDGKLTALSKYDEEAKKYRKHHFGEGHLSRSGVGSYENELVIKDATFARGYELRTTPKTLRKIFDFLIQDELNFFNCIAFGWSATKLSKKLSGDKLGTVRARFQSRNYQKDGKTMTAYEVCVTDFGGDGITDVFTMGSEGVLWY